MIPLTRPVVGREELEALAATLESGWLTQGPRIAEFEAQVAAYCGVWHAVACCNCTACCTWRCACSMSARATKSLCRR